MIGHLQQTYDKYKDKGVVMLGVNVSDTKTVAGRFLTENKVTFPNIVDNSPEANKVIDTQYMCQGVPLEYIIDGEGKIVKGWYGEGGNAGEKTLEGLGIK